MAYKTTGKITIEITGKDLSDLVENSLDVDLSNDGPICAALDRIIAKHAISAIKDLDESAIRKIVVEQVKEKIRRWVS